MPLRHLASYCCCCSSYCCLSGIALNVAAAARNSRHCCLHCVHCRLSVVNRLDLLRAEGSSGKMTAVQSVNEVGTAAPPHRCMNAPASQAPHPVLECERCHACITTHKRATCTT
jgi:hypothetical protein